MVFVHRRSTRPALAALLSVIFLSTLSAADAGQINVTLTVDSRSTIRTIDQQMFGLNTAAWDSELGAPITVKLLEKTSARSFRYPGGSWADGFDWTKPRWPGMPMTREFGALVEALHGDGVIIVNYGTGSPQMAAAWAAYCEANPSSNIVLGSDSSGKDWKTAGYWASLRASTPLTHDDGLNRLRASHSAPYPFHHFEVGNECYGSWETDSHQQRQDPVLYAQFFAETAKLIKLVDPTAMVGAVITGGDDGDGDQQESVVNPVTKAVHSGWTPCVLRTLRGLHSLPDFVIYHIYPQQPGLEDDAVLLSAPQSWTSIAATIKTMIDDYYPEAASHVQLWCTENNSVTFNPGAQSTSIVDGIYLADSFGSIITTPFQGYYWWCLRNGVSTNYNNDPKLYGWRRYGDYGILATGKSEPNSPTDTPYPTYFALELISHFCAPGDRVLTAGSSNPLITVYAVRKKNGAIGLLMINKSPLSTADAAIAIRGLRFSKSAQSWTYGIDQDTAQANGEEGHIASEELPTKGNTMQLTLAPYSMTVVQSIQ